MMADHEAVDAWNKAVQLLKSGKGSEAVVLFKELHQLGYVEAAESLADLYQTGAEEISVDHTAARYWFEVALEQNGDSRVQVALATIILKSFPDEHTTAVSLLQSAAGNNNGIAHMILANLYENGLYVHVNPEAAFYHYNRAASLGLVIAIARLSRLSFRRGNFILGLFLRLKAAYCALKFSIKNPNDLRLWHLT